MSAWVTLVAEGGLHADEDVAEGLAVDEQVLAVAVEVAGGRAPVLLEVGGVRRELLVGVRVGVKGKGQG